MTNNHESNLFSEPSLETFQVAIIIANAISILL